MRRATVLPLVALFSVFTYFSFAQTSDSGGPGENEPQPPCIDCIVHSFGERDKTVIDPACQQEWKGEADRRFYVGRCIRYMCVTGYYYAFDGWYQLPLYNCTDTVIDSASQCPAGSCKYDPELTDGRALTTGEAARLNREAMKGANAR